MKIRNIAIFRVSGHWTGANFPAGDRQVQSLDIYPEFNRPVDSQWKKNQLIHALYVEVQTDEGISGLFGPIQGEQAFVIQKFLRPFLIGRDPLSTERLLDQMFRLNRHGRSGLFMTGVSPVDCALWDLKGKVWEKPVYRLLGGPTRTSVPAYASMLGFPITPNKASRIAKEYKAKGYEAQKWFFRYGPADGEEGKQKNLVMAHAVRGAVGPHYTLMFDAFMGWTTSYAKDMVRALETVNPFWVEEPIPPERVGGLRKIREATRVPIATGEHVYTRWQVKELLVNEAVDVVQTDPDWTGGITELVKICALTSAFEVPMVAHGHSLLPALHVAGAQSPATVPFVEFLIQHQERKQFFHTPIYHPQKGLLKLPKLPGLGLVLDQNKVERREIFR